jgi:hypothetical protein
MRVAFAHRLQCALDDRLGGGEIGVAHAQQDDILVTVHGLFGQVVQVPGVRGFTLDAIG